MQAVQRFIAEPYIDINKPSIAPSPSRPSRAVHRDIVELSSALLPSCLGFVAEPSIAQPSIAKPSIASSCPSQAVHPDIAEPSIAPSPSHFLQAVHHEPSIAASSSCHLHCFIA
jgi:hypothetical protein